MNIEKSKSTEKRLSREEEAYKRKMKFLHGQESYPQYLIDKGRDQPKFHLKKYRNKSKYSLPAENFDERQPRNSRRNLSLENFGIDGDDFDRNQSKSRERISTENFDIEDNSDGGPTELKMENFLDNEESQINFESLGSLLDELEKDLIKALVKKNAWS